jgi:two-component system nitrogen regulation response regulator GlnG
MALRSSAFTILALTSDTEAQVQLRQALKEAAVTVVRDPAAFQREASKHCFDAVVLELRGGLDKMVSLLTSIDPSHTLVITGSRTVLKKAIKTLQRLTRHSLQPGLSHQGKIRDDSLQSYLEAKMGDFVRDMKNGDAKNLYPILIAAVERPLIASVLRETNGNQIQAAELLGLNRNTLRKKILDLHIPLKRSKTRQR